MNQDLLKSILDYNLLTGIFIWKISPAYNVKIGDVAGSLHKETGYIIIRYKGQAYFGHTLAWLYVHGEWVMYLDHKDTTRINNSIYNLRKANQSLNGANRKLNSNNKTGYKGVHVNRHGNFAATIKFQGRTIHLGTYKTRELAHEAYCAKAIELFGAFHREGIAS